MHEPVKQVAELALPGRPRLEVHVGQRVPNNCIGIPCGLPLNTRVKERRKVTALEILLRIYTRTSPKLPETALSGDSHQSESD